MGDSKVVPKEVWLVVDKDGDQWGTYTDPDSGPQRASRDAREYSRDYPQFTPYTFHRYVFADAGEVKDA